MTFSSTSQGEIHGIGFEDDNSLTSARYFKVYGTQNYGITNFDNYSGGTVTYTIPVGDSYTGTMDRLVFINDNDAGSGNNSTFSNVKIYEGTCEGSVIAENFGTRIDILGDDDEANTLEVLLAPNPITKGHRLKIMAPETDLSGTTYSVINLLGKVIKTGEINKDNALNVDDLPSGVYILGIKTESATVNKRFVVE